MEKDVEILEKLLIYWNSLIKYADTDKKGVVYKWINTEGVVEKRDALLNLINRVKELDNYYKDMEEVNKKFIAVDKIKEKIESLRDVIRYSANPLAIDNSKYAIDILQELLEEE